MDQLQEPDTYQFASFGVNSSPFLAQFLTQHHVRQMSEKLPKSAETVLKGTYMDASLASFKTESEAKEAHNQLVKLWSSCRMKARKWISNSTKVPSTIPQEDRAKELELSDEQPTTKIWGVFWMAQQDVLTFKDDNSDLDRIVTKRGFVKRLAAVFDHFGFLSPFIVQGKMLLQELWIAGVNWDEPSPTELSQKLRKWVAQFDLLSSITVPQNLLIQNAIAKTLHVFSDVSEKAFRTVVYMRSVHSNGTNLVANKAWKELVTDLDDETIRESLANRGVKCFFNPLLAPHFGGVHQSIFKAAKRAVVAILGNSDVKDVEFLTAFTGTEALINSRLLTYQSASPHDDVH